MVARVANGLELDTHLRRNHGELLELETRNSLLGREGKLRFLSWVNHANMGRYRAALRSTGTPDITATGRPGTPKYGLGLNIEQALRRDVGAFLRTGWNDGKTESWMFTEIDRTFQLGFQFKGAPWTRPQDILAVGLVTNGLSRDHRDYLGAGGSGFHLGDGRLNYARERVLEAYYALKVQKRFTLTLDYQRAQNPGYNQDRGPISIWTLRFHWEM
jgi:high affinity Mn2+ porin